MKHRTKLAARTFLSVSLAGGVAALLQGCPDQPEMQCNFARGPFSARYDVLEKTGTCDDVPELVGELVWVEQYFAEKSGRKPDLDKPSVALQSGTMGGLAQTAAGQEVSDPNPDHKLYALGAVNSPDPASNFCTVGSFSAAQLELPELPPGEPVGDGGVDDSGAPEGGSDDAGDTDAADAGSDVSTGGDDAAPEAAAQEEPPPPFPGQAAVNMRYDWSNVRFLVRPEIPGQAFDGDLAVTQSGCTIRYRVNAISYPALFRIGTCALPDEDGNPVPNDAACATKANPAIGLAYGSALNPRFKTRCEPSTLNCVLTNDVSDYQ